MASPVDYLPLLTHELEKRLPRILRNKRYAMGDADLPEMGNNLRASWVAFQKKARTNYAGLTCSSLASRISPTGLRVGDGSAGAVEIVARRLWRDNRLDTVFSDAIWNMLTTSTGYLLAGVNSQGQPVITSEDPRFMVTLPDVLQPWKAKAALKVWSDTDLDYAAVWIPGQMQMFGRDRKGSSGLRFGDDWESLSEIIEFDGGIPVHVLENRNNVAEFEEHIDVIDRINLGKLQRLVTTAMQAFKQRGIKGDLADEDADGNAIDWAKAFEPAPGALWELPDGIDVWESQQTDIRPMLEAEKADAREYAAVTQTPVDVLVPDAANQSGQGALNVRQGEIAKAKKRIEIVKPVFEGVILDALRILGFQGDDTIELRFAPPEHVSFIEKAQAAKLAVEAGQPAAWVDEHIWGLSPDEVAENAQMRAADQLALFMQAVPGEGE